MYEYKIETYEAFIMDASAAEKAMNALAKEGWRVISVIYNDDMCYSLVVTYERKLS